LGHGLARGVSFFVFLCSGAKKKKLPVSKKKSIRQARRGDIRYEGMVHSGKWILHSLQPPDGRAHARFFLSYVTKQPKKQKKHARTQKKKKENK
jgi:hypothetical protein